MALVLPSGSQPLTWRAAVATVGPTERRQRGSRTDQSPPGQLLREWNVSCAHEEERTRKTRGARCGGQSPKVGGEAAGGGEVTGRLNGSKQQPCGSEPHGSGIHREPGPGLKYSHYPAASAVRSLGPASWLLWGSSRVAAGVWFSPRGSTIGGPTTSLPRGWAQLTSWGCEIARGPGLWPAAGWLPWALTGCCGPLIPCGPLTTQQCLQAPRAGPDSHGKHQREISGASCSRRSKVGASKWGSCPESANGRQCHTAGIPWEMDWASHSSGWPCEIRSGGPREAGPLTQLSHLGWESHSRHPEPRPDQHIPPLDWLREQVAGGWHAPARGAPGPRTHTAPASCWDSGHLQTTVHPHPNQRPCWDGMQGVSGQPHSPDVSPALGARGCSS